MLQFIIGIIIGLMILAALTPVKKKKSYKKNNDNGYNVILQEYEDRKIDQEIDYNVRQMMHSYTHGEMICLMPMNLLYKVSNKETARHLNKNLEDIVRFKYQTKKDAYDLEHGPVTCKFMQSLKKPQF